MMELFELVVFRNAVAGNPIFSHRSTSVFMPPSVGEGISMGSGAVLTITHIQHQFLPQADGTCIQRCIIVTN
jgi:hypothetical protein